MVICHRFDIIFIHRETYPLGGAFFERTFKILKKRIVYDFDDALFLPNISESNKFLSFFKNPDKIKSIINLSDSVIAGNSYLQEFALRFNNNVKVLATAIDSHKYTPLHERKKKQNVTIGWIGSVSTSIYLPALANVFKEIRVKYPHARFIAVGSGFGGLRFLEDCISFKEWSLENEIADLQSFDVGIMPLIDNEWAKGKCAFKAIQYMSVGIPVVASRVGMNTEVIQDGVNGYLVDNQKEWIEKLSMLIENTALRQAMGNAGRKTVEEKYAVEVNAKQFLRIIEDAYSKR
ncbi:MAG: glycosyltransferase family 4 protein [Candidatus Omnitrophica bacterium]|nr:glycosyltransferase family 4 protein [Candidatus Omnitrophota bacterium]